MKKVLALAIISFALVSCGQSNTNNNAKNGQSGQNQTSNAAVKEGDTVAVDYVGKFPDGKVFDTSIADEAKKAGTFTESRTYKPLEFGVKADGGVIEGFWKGVIGMKVGEKKTITLSPKEAYGEQWERAQEQIVSKKAFAPTIEEKIPRSEIADTIVTKVPRNILEGQGKLPKVGEVITDDKGQSATVTAIDEENVTVSIDNSNNPFHGKKLVVGTTVDFEGNTAKIIAVDKDTITVSTENKVNPFAGKKLEVGLEGTYQESQKIKIKKIEGDNVTLLIDGPMAGKTLVFDLELKEIKQ